jgi:uncharacterized membrane-anchored protein
MFETATSLHAAPAWLERVVGAWKGRERAILLAGIGLQMAVLVGMIATRAMPHLTGDAILVRVVPVDPRDMFRGDYVTLGYEFSRIPPGGIPGLPRDALHSRSSEWQGRAVYVTLVPEPDGKHWKASTYSLTQPPSGTYLCGQIGDFGRLEFGIESYFVQEGKGRQYEDAVRSRRLCAEISVAPNGQAGLKALHVE